MSPVEVYSSKFGIIYNFHISMIGIINKSEIMIFIRVEIICKGGNGNWRNLVQPMLRKSSPDENVPSKWHMASFLYIEGWEWNAVCETDLNSLTGRYLLFSVNVLWVCLVMDLCVNKGHEGELWASAAWHYHLLWSQSPVVETREQKEQCTVSC